MGQLIMWNIVSLDGCFEGTTPWSLGWFQHRLNDAFFSFVTEQLRTADALVFGRATYEGMAAHWSTATGEVADLMNTLPKTVFSRTLSDSAWGNTRITAEDPAEAIGTLKRNVPGNIFVFGSATLSLPLFNAGLFDEIRLGLTSVIVGQGRKLFPPESEFRDLNLREARVLSPSCVVLHYTKPAAPIAAQ